jgi:hypothetical protein
MSPADRLRLLAHLDALQRAIEDTRAQVVAEDRRATAARYSGPGSTAQRAQHLAAQLRAAGRTDVVATIALRLNISKRWARKLVNDPPKRKPVASVWEAGGIDGRN